MSRRTDQVLVFDADDTLWENNVLFERVIDDFLDWLAHPTLSKPELRAILDDIEAANAVTHGYGSTVFLRSLRECFERLRERPASDHERRRIDDLARALVDHEIELIPGVEETLAELATRHRLVLLTKGAPEEQQRKIEASDLGQHFGSVRVVPEKNVEVYRQLTVEQSFRPELTWMIGNSPKSDILPARAAGLGAVFIPNAHTWVLEHAYLDPDDDGVLHLEKFTQLLDHF